MEDITECPICGNNELTTFLECKDHLVSKETFVLRSCGSCDLLITTPRPGQLAGYYQSADYVSHTSSGTNFVNRLYLTARTFTLRQKLNLVKKYTAKGKILDLGCGTGDFLAVCHKAGWDTQGVEPSAEAQAIARKKIHAVTASLQENTHTGFSVITLWHVLEHLPDPDQTLKTLHYKLDTNGTIFIAVPNFRSYDAAWYKAGWAGYDVPRHLWHFSQRAMKQLLQKHSFNLVQTLPMKLDGFYVSLLSERYLRNGSLPAGAMAQAFYRGLMSNLAARKSNDYSSLIYIAKK